MSALASVAIFVAAIDPKEKLRGQKTLTRRSEPSSRAAFMGEQPNPWGKLPPQGSERYVTQRRWLGRSMAALCVYL